MIDQINLLRNIGQFDSVSPTADMIFTPFTLVYAENGRGKTTLASIFRSVANGDSEIVEERRRLGSAHAPHIVLSCNGQQSIFENGAWSQTVPEIVIFDDTFVSANVCSGIDLDSSHKQNLHELILGERGVVLNSELRGYVSQIEQHNVDLRLKGNAIPSVARGPFSVDAFCSLQNQQDIDIAIQEAKRRLAAAKSADTIRHRPGFVPIVLPDFNVEELDAVLGLGLADLQANAAARVRLHIENLGQGGEAWVADGMPRIAEISKDQDDTICPFCSQTLQGSELIDNYNVYFSEEYEALKTKVLQTGMGVRDTHGKDVPAAFERTIRTAAQTHEFWKDFTEIPPITVDTARIARDWKMAREAVLNQLRTKAGSLLDKEVLSKKTKEAIVNYQAHIAEIEALSTNLAVCNDQLDLVKEQAAGDDVASLNDDLIKLKATQARYEPAIAAFCDEYLAEKAAKKDTETRRKDARSALDKSRGGFFPAYETAINDYLRRLNANFKIGRVQSVNTRAGSSASYCVLVNQQEVNITAENGPSFKNTLSSGDRNTLALAFFFASLEQDSNLAQKVVVFDDPMTSLDEHRRLTTRQEMRTLSRNVSQMIVLSHSKQFLCALWDAADSNLCSAYRIGRAAVGSEIIAWDVRSDIVTEHDKRHEMVSRYIQQADPEIERKVAEALRPILEAFTRVAYPADFPPGSLLGRFVESCQRLHGSIGETLSLDDTTELRALLDYANRFHHDSNPAWETEIINDAELIDFARRTLLFASRPCMARTVI